MLKPPEGMNEMRGVIYRLNRPVYGLQSAPKSWNDKLHGKLHEFRFERSRAGACVYVFKQEPLRCVLTVYVDDFLVTGHDDDLIENLRDYLCNEFGIKDLGEATKFIGIEIQRDRESNVTHLSQREYIYEVLDAYGMRECNPTKLPMDPGLRINNTTLDKNYQTKVRALLGSLGYIARGTRPDISFAVNFLSRYQSTANKEIFDCAKRILRYLNRMIEYTLKYQQKNSASIEPISIYVDSDFAGDAADRKSTTGVMVNVSGNLIDWYVRKQTATALSSGEAEYIAVSAAGKLACAWRNFLVATGDQVKNIPVYSDSSVAIAIATTSESRRTRHIDVCYHYVRDLIRKGVINLRKIRSSDQLADVLTKAVSGAVLERLNGIIFDL